MTALCAHHILECRLVLLVTGLAPVLLSQEQVILSSLKLQGCGGGREGQNWSSSSSLVKRNLLGH